MGNIWFIWLSIGFVSGIGIAILFYGLVHFAKKVKYRYDNWTIASAIIKNISDRLQANELFETTRDPEKLLEDLRKINEGFRHLSAHFPTATPSSNDKDLPKQPE